MIDYIPGGSVDVHAELKPFQIKQYDNNSHKLYLTVIDRDNPFGKTVNLEGHTVTAYFRLPDGSDEHVVCEIVKAKTGRIAVPFPGSVTQQIGTVQCEIRIVGEGMSIVSLRKFTFEVMESIYDSASIEATEKYSALDVLISQAQGYRNELDSLQAELDGLGLDEIRERLETVAAGLTTVQENIEDLQSCISTQEEFLSLFDRSYDVASGNGETGGDTPVVITAPSAPANVTATAGDSSIAISWSAVAGAEYYAVERTTNGGASWTTIASNITGTNYTDSTAVAGTSYRYAVTAHKTFGSGVLSSGRGALSETVSIQQAPVAETPPAAPASITATAGSGSIAVTWAESSGAAYYTLERKAGSGTWSAIAQNYTGRSYTDSSVTAGTTYQYRVTAHKTGTSGVLSSSPTTSDAVTAQAGTPSGNVTLNAPASVTATAGSGQVSVTWGAVSGASRYQLERSADNGATWTTLLLYQTANSYTDTTVASGTSYKYRVTAFSSSGDTSPAAVSSSTTPQAAPAAVIGGNAILSSETAATVVANITVGWNLGNTLDCCNDPVQLRTGQANSVFGAGIRSIGSENEGKAYETSWGDTPITTQEMLEAVVNAGFNAIRIPVTWNHHLRDEALPYDWGVDVIDSGRYTTDIPQYPNLSGTVIISPFFLKRVKEVVNMALNAGFRYVILDTHHDTADFNSASSRTLYYAKNVTGLPWLTDIPYQLFHCSNRLGPRLENVSGMTVEKDFQNMCDYMYQLWTMIATEFKDYDYRLIFEGFNEMLNWARAWDQTYHAGNGNEVTATQHQRFNAFNNTFIKAVRNAGGAYNPTRVLSCETFGAVTTDFIVNGFSLSNVPDSFKSTNYCLTDSEISAENSRIILQAHYYNDVPNNFQTAAESVASTGLPVIFGEVGWHINSGAPSDLYNFGYNLVQKSKSAGAKVFWWDNNKTGTGKDCYGVLNRWNTKNGTVAWDKEALKNGLIAGANAT